MNWTRETTATDVDGQANLVHLMVDISIEITCAYLICINLWSRETHSWTLKYYLFAPSTHTQCPMSVFVFVWMYGCLEALPCPLFPWKGANEIIKDQMAFDGQLFSRWHIWWQEIIVRFIFQFENSLQLSLVCRSTWTSMNQRTLGPRSKCHDPRVKLNLMNYNREQECPHGCTVCHYFQCYHCSWYSWPRMNVYLSHWCDDCYNWTWLICY